MSQYRTAIPSHEKPLRGYKAPFEGVVPYAYGLALHRKLRFD
ncbi:hypothetical protein ACVWVY_005996 [Bradyrhizobium sp. URHC0002]